MKGPFVIGVAGPMGAGKTYFVDLLILYLLSIGIEVKRVSVGDIFRGILRRENKDPTDRKLLHKESKKFLETVSDKNLLSWMKENLPEFGWDQGFIVVDGIRLPGNYEGMKELFPHNALVYCHCPEETRIVRIMDRANLSREDVMESFSDKMEKVDDGYFLSQTNLILTPDDNPIEIAESIRLLLEEYLK